MQDNPDVMKMADVELVYNISRSSVLSQGYEGSCIPPWGLFHAATDSEINHAISSVSFNPIVMANPTNHQIIYTILRRIKESINNLGQEHIPILFDIGMLMKALEITWAHLEDLSGVILCDGGMHPVICTVSGIGHLYGDAGLRSLMSESEDFAALSVHKILTGKDFDRALYGLKLVDEALSARLFHNFNIWCKNSGKDLELNHLLQQLEEKLAKPGETDFNNLILEIGNKVKPLLDVFRKKGRNISPAFQFWDDCLFRVLQPLKIYIAATRVCFWEIHESTVAHLLPLLFATNRYNYAKYMPVVLLQQQRLPREIAEAFKEGFFVAKLLKGKFNSVWMDYTTEATENKTLKGAGGIIGLTLRERALAQWFLSRPVTAQYSEQMRKNVTEF